MRRTYRRIIWSRLFSIDLAVSSEAGTSEMLRGTEGVSLKPFSIALAGSLIV